MPISFVRIDSYHFMGHITTRSQKDRILQQQEKRGILKFQKKFYFQFKEK